MLVQLTPLQARVIGVLMEKEVTTPDQYPLSLNALMLGCNQKSNRYPFMQLSENEVQDVLNELREKNLTFEDNSSGRVVKYKHRFCNTEFSSLKFTQQQTAIVCVLLLRGPQTPGELRTRTNRQAEFENVAEVEQVLHSLFDFNSEAIVVKLAREPGKRESRFAHLFCGDENIQTDNSEYNSGSADSSITQVSVCTDDDAVTKRLLALEDQVSFLKQEITALKEIIEPFK
ncbi:YceH family protein [Glaciecola petra]|uniref:YceH family protein n=1 Tax=Glaciecola petra TaxID=3075602 RepID=A0ABU2ZST2_9ALTE|nr:YceH family protein [Aestuariibacter sp. P117]MDT0595316.1 YceH family protein [Aestuariibacter sp. P117]